MGWNRPREQRDAIREVKADIKSARRAEREADDWPAVEAAQARHHRLSADLRILQGKPVDPDDPAFTFRSDHAAMVEAHDAAGIPLQDDPENDPETAAMLAHWQAGGEPRSTVEGYWQAHWQKQADAAYRAAWEAQGRPPTEEEMRLIEEEGRAGAPTPDPSGIDDMAHWRAQHDDAEIPGHTLRYAARMAELTGADPDTFIERAHGEPDEQWFSENSGDEVAFDPIAVTRDYEGEPEFWPAHERQGIATDQATANVDQPDGTPYVGTSRGGRPMTADEAAQAADIADYVTTVMGSPQEAAEVLADAKWYSSPVEPEQNEAGQ